MKILHLCLSCFYIDNYSYQENLLPKYHKKMGHIVRIVASTETFDKNGRLTYTKPGEYCNEDGICVTRIPYKYRFIHKAAKKIRKYVGLEDQLYAFMPDLIFIHGPEFGDTKIVARFAKKNSVRMICDCHSDFSNSGRNLLSRYILNGLYYRKCTRRLIPYVSKFYGVLPARVDFLTNVLGVPKNKCGLLVMGVDDELAEETSQLSRSSVRKSLGISKNDFLIVTGGKIDVFKNQTLSLMRAVNNLDNDNVKLLIFGSVCQELKSDFDALCANSKERIVYVGWKNVKDSYGIFYASDLVVFPGRHSVYWEQAVGLGCPLIVKRWPGTEHVNTDDNVLFLETDSDAEIESKLSLMLNNEDEYARVKSNALLAKKHFLYSSIAKKSLEE